MVAFQEPTLCDDVDASAKQSLQITDQVDLVEQAPVGFKCDKEIHVARLGCLAAGHRPEDPHRTRPAFPCSRKDGGA